jgi:hypothetical protein
VDVGVDPGERGGVGEQGEGLRPAGPGVAEGQRVGLVGDDAARG